MTASALMSTGGKRWLRDAIGAAEAGSLEDARADARRLDPPALAAALVLCDLLAGGWSVSVEGDDLRVSPPERAAGRDGERARVRRQMASERQSQLDTPAVKAFLRKMESPRLRAGGFSSIFSVMHDGRQLVERIRAGGVGVFQPYVQVADPGEPCPETGLDLGEVWRYFRHTWLTPYRSTPGRGVMFLVRDGAWKGHPVMGIAMLGSAAPQIAVRDRWIGWEAGEVIRECADAPTAERARWLTSTLDGELEGIMIADLLADGVLAPRDLSQPREHTAALLRAEARARRREHARYGDGAALRETPEADVLSEPAQAEQAWETRARSPLFRAKRAELLAQIVLARRVVGDALAGGDLEGLRALARTGDGRRALTVAARRWKASLMGVAIADLQICGAVSPFREILGGKLVAMLMTSRDALRAYDDRYAGRASVIASSMAGRPVVRDGRIALLTTAGLFGGGSSQYNRIRGVEPSAAYLEIGATEGFGSMHLSEEAGVALAAVIAHGRGGAKRYSLFGEGVSPRLRMLREGLDRVGLPSDVILRHGVQRTMYAAPLARNARAYLRGLDRDLEGTVDGAAADIALAWRDRWLRGRIGRPGVLESAARHTLQRPVRHGARVEATDEGET